MVSEGAVAFRSAPVTGMYPTVSVSAPDFNGWTFSGQFEDDATLIVVGILAPLTGVSEYMCQPGSTLASSLPSTVVPGAALQTGRSSGATHRRGAP